MRALNPIRMMVIDFKYSGDQRSRKIIEGINQQFDRRLN